MIDTGKFKNFDFAVELSKHQFDDVVKYAAVVADSTRGAIVDDGTFAGTAYAMLKLAAERLGIVKPAPRLFIHARRWFSRHGGNTYHSVTIDDGMTRLARVDFAYGYGDQWQETAREMLSKLGYAKPEGENSTIWFRETLGAVYDCIDVQRKKDL